ncbi:hmu [Symbiodinium sp. KB8]|nr:hmu [Symbiodinium sp. KB8]
MRSSIPAQSPEEGHGAIPPLSAGKEEEGNWASKEFLGSVGARSSSEVELSKTTRTAGSIAARHDAESARRKPKGNYVEEEGDVASRWAAQRFFFQGSRPGKVNWKFADVERLAKGWHAAMPEKVPSGFLLTDAFLLMDEMLSFGDNSTDDRVRELKQMLAPSPRKAKQDMESDEDSWSGLSSSSDDGDAEAEAGDDEIASSWPAPVAADSGDSSSDSEKDCHEASRHSADPDKDCAGSDERSASDSDKDCPGSDEHSASDSKKDCPGSDEHSSDSEKDCPGSDKHSDSEKDCPGSEKESGHLAWGRGKSTADLGAVCPYEDSDNDSSEGDDGKIDDFAAVIQTSAPGVKADQLVDGDTDDSDVDSQATLRLGELPKKRRKMISPDASKAKCSERAADALHDELLDAGHRAVGGGRPSNVSSVGSASMRTPLCKSKGLCDLETLTPTPVPFPKKKKSKVAKPEPCDPAPRRKLATFKRHHARRVLKKKLKKSIRANKRALKELNEKQKTRAAEASAEAKDGEDEYQGYSLKDLPLETRPQDRKNVGKHSYTLKSAVGKATIEVLLRHNAFFVKIVDDKASGPKGQISWKKQTPASAWALAKERSGYVVPRS